MQRRVLGVVLASAGVIALAVPARAHHSFNAAFDDSEPVAVRGVITEIRWENPHTWFLVDTTAQTGKDAKAGKETMSWRFQGEGPNWLLRHGTKRDFLKVGERVTVKGFHARDTAQNVAAAREIVRADGRSFTLGPWVPAE